MPVLLPLAMEFVQRASIILETFPQITDSQAEDLKRYKLIALKESNQFHTIIQQIEFYKNNLAIIKDRLAWETDETVIDYLSNLIDTIVNKINKLNKVQQKKVQIPELNMIKEIRRNYNRPKNN